MLDDAFLFHEDLALLWFGIDEKIVLLVLGVFVLVYLVCFSRLILRTQFGALFLAFLFLALSVVVDTILAPWLFEIGDWMYLWEDGAKWLGIAFWCSYFLSVSYTFVMQANATGPVEGNAAA